jgi:hypothetical protein
MTGIGGARPCALKVECKVLHELILTRANERTARWPLPRFFGAPPPAAASSAYHARRRPQPRVPARCGPCRRIEAPSEWR